MANIIQLRKGLDIRLNGAAAHEKMTVKSNGKYCLCPDDFTGVVPKVVVKEGDKVKAGDALFINKNFPRVKFASPVSGVVTAVIRGDRRKVLGVSVSADSEQEYVDFGKKDVTTLSGAEVKECLLEAGLFGFIDQLPYAVSTNESTTPKAVFVSALRDKPLAADFEYELSGQENEFQTGITALSKIAPVYLGIGSRMSAPALVSARDAEVTVFDGPCPAGNVGVHVNHLCPVNKGEVVWTVDPTAVIMFGRLFLEGRVDMRRTVALCGPRVIKPMYADMLVGQELSTLLSNSISNDGKDARIINGNVLTGRTTDINGYLGAHSSEITVIDEGANADEFVGWIMPRFGQFSTSRSYFSWLLGGSRRYSPDARIKGGQRHMIMSGEYNKVIPMDIYAEYLIKAILAGDIDRMEQLGIYEVSPEDFALAEFVDSSKLELQRIVREGLDMLRKENL